MPEDRNEGLKSAYELALERLASEGIAAPDRAALSDDTRARIAEARRKAEARLAELEIQFARKRRELDDPAALAQAEEEYRIDCRRIEERREAEIRKLRSDG
ncbi:MAG: hypothetical protein R3325_07670 [Thermoanaerobaculia bacterium]|nr:hypothetical protein [Thermoanaerobaculia bacterium]